MNSFCSLAGAVAEMIRIIPYIGFDMGYFLKIMFNVGIIPAVLLALAAFLIVLISWINSLFMDAFGSIAENTEELLYYNTEKYEQK